MPRHRGPAILPGVIRLVRRSQNPFNPCRMSQPNPYAPPAVHDLEAAPSLRWQVDGSSLFVRNGVRLPEVDLETGALGEGLIPVQRRHDGMLPMKLLGGGVLIAIFYVADHWLRGSGLGPFLVLYVFLLLGFWLLRLRGPGASLVIVSVFREARLENHRKLRQRIRTWLSLALAAVILLVPSFLSNQFYSRLKEVEYLFGLAGLFFAAMGVWRLLDRPRPRVRAGPPGWLRIPRVHPAALAEFARLEAMERASVAAGGPQRPRRVHTTFYHRFPLRVLLGKRGMRTPRAISLLVMKWLRSRHLVRDTYHFSEAETVAADTLHEKIRGLTQEWLAAHAGWSLVTAERLLPLSGEVVSECAYLAAPGWQHLLTITHAWLGQRAGSEPCGLTFQTKTAAGITFGTTNQPLLPFKQAHTDNCTVRGTSEEIFQCHLARLGNREIDAPESLAALRQRILQSKQEFFDLAAAHGLYGPVREIS